MSRRDAKPYSVCPALIFYSCFSAHLFQRPEVDGQWKHDLHQTAQSTLLDRIAPSPGQSLASRLTGGKKELFPDSSSSPSSGRAAGRGSNAGVNFSPLGDLLLVRHPQEEPEEGLSGALEWTKRAENC